MSGRLRIVRSALLVAIFIIVGKSLAAAREVALAAHYGTSELVDAYLIAVTLVNWPLSVWLGSMTVVLVPYLVRSRSEGRGADQALVDALAVALGIGAVLATLLSIGYPTLVHALLPSASAALVAHLTGMLPMMAVLMITGFLSAIFVCRLIASERQIYMLLEGLPAASVTVAILMSAAAGVGPLVWGTIVGAALHLVVLAALPPRLTVVPPQLRSEVWSEFAKSFALVAGGQTVLSATTLLDQLMVVQLGPGSVSELGYANRILALALAIGATAISRATLPVFSELVARSDDAAPRQFFFWAMALFGFGGAILLIGWGLAPMAVSFLFARGEFGEDDVNRVSEILRFGLLQLPFYFSAIVCTQAIAARRGFETLFRVSMVMTIVKILANVMLVPEVGVGGVQVANALMYMAALAYLATGLISRRDRLRSVKAD